MPRFFDSRSPLSGATATRVLALWLCAAAGLVHAATPSDGATPKKAAQGKAVAAKSQPPASTPDAYLYESGEPFRIKNPIDRWVREDLKAHGLKPLPQCSDGVFLRRIYLDTTGTIPTPEQARAFLDSKEPDKRARLISSLLASPAHATYWTLKWGDLLRVKAEFPINLWPNAAQAYSQYIRQSVAQNKSVNQLAAELVTASGSNFRDPASNFFRAMQGRGSKHIAEAVALVFLGTRADSMPPEDLAALALFFDRVRYKTTNEWKEEIVYTDPFERAALSLRFPDHTPANIPEGADPRAAFAAWLTHPQNALFARAQVNRHWYWVMGIPLYDSVDKLTTASQPTNPQLTAHLVDVFVKSGGDARALLSHIFNSATYQQSSLLNTDNPEALRRFGAYPIRQLEAEPLIDAICKVTGTTEIYTSTTPEPYTTLPTCEDAVSIPDGSITTAFLDLFGRAARDTGMADERDPNPSAAQRLHLLNASHIRKKIEQGTFARTPPKGTGLPQLAQDIYLRTLSRFPSDTELAILNERDPKNPQRPKYPVNDIYWALINSDEFLNRH